jgi:hypothetical protein
VSIRYDARVPWTRRSTTTSEKLLGVCCRAGEAFAVGARGTVQRWDGVRWSPEESGTHENLYAVACTRDAVIAVGGDLHIGGDSLILHRQGNAWTREPSGMQHILLSVARGGLGWFAGGYNGGIIRGQPGAWSRVDIVHYSHVFAVAVTEGHVFAAGLNGTATEFDGQVWRPHDTHVGTHLRALGVLGERELLAVGLSGTILRYDGVEWSSMESPTGSHLEAIWVAGATEAYAVGYAGTALRFDGTSWRSTDCGVRANLHGVHGSDNEVIAVGSDGVAVHLDRRAGH